MSATTRWMRIQKAIEEGKQAYLDGVPESHCPYKVSDWGLGGWWLMGHKKGNKSRAKQEKGEMHDKLLHGVVSDNWS